MSEADPAHEPFMRRAIELARKAWGETHPNPMVGALIVEGGRVVAEGWHRAAGRPHAEVEALRALGRAPSAEATLYVTLEPCSTCGRTGACTDAILESGIRRVVVGASDPNPAHAGRGLEILREGGLDLCAGVLAEECADLNLIFNHWITRGEPLFAFKIATTLDGKFAAASGHSRWVTGEAARADVMRWRRYFPAIAVSGRTVLADNPALTSRADRAPWCPRRFVLDRELNTLERPTELQVYTDPFRERTTVVHAAEAPADRLAALADSGLASWVLPAGPGGIDLAAFRRRCAEEAICGVYFEPGPRLAGALIEGGQADYAFVYQAPKFLADSDARGIGRPRASRLMSEAFALSELRREAFGPDQLTRGYLK